MSYLTRAIGAVKLASKAHAPTIMVVTGVASMGAAVVAASKKTLNNEQILAPAVAELEAIENNEGYITLDDSGKAKARNKVYAKVSVDMARNYFVPSVLFVGGAGLVFGGHRIMIKRNATLAIAFTGVQKAFDAYRARVREAYGDEADRAMRQGSVVARIHDEKEDEDYYAYQLDWAGGVGGDPYNRIFDSESSTQWIDDLGVNKLFLSNQQRMANIKLGLQGYLYLNEVYEALGFAPTPVGQVCGWKVKYLPDGSKDIPFVDFGIDTALPDDWKYNDKNAVYLDFNCQGLIVGGTVQKELER